MLARSVLRRCAGKLLTPPAVIAGAQLALPDRGLPAHENLVRAEALAATADATLSAPDALNALRALQATSVRHEAAVRRCLLTVLTSETGSTPADTAAGALEVMASLGFTSDARLVAAALGKCVETAPRLSLQGVLAALGGLRALRRDTFSLTEVGLSESNLGASDTYLEAHERDDPSLAELMNQPNLLLVLRAALEERLTALCAADSVTAATAEEWASLLSAVADGGGVLRTDTAEAMALLTERLSGGGCRRALPPLPTASLVALALPLARLRLYEAGPDYEYSHARSAVEAAKTRALTCLSAVACRRRDLHRALRLDPRLCLALRRAFEEEAVLWRAAPELWDVVRAVRCRPSRLRQPSTGRLGGRLFDRKYDVKLQRVSGRDRSSDEARVPPQFKSWQTPEHKGPGGHHHKKNPRVVKFGVRKISSGYIRSKRKKHAPH